MNSVPERALDWSDFHRRSLLRPVRELLRRTVGCFELEEQEPGVAVDLGCGAGAETIELLRRGWQVHAVDSDSGGIRLLEGSIPESSRALLKTHVANFDKFDFPCCDLIWAGYSWPYCAAEFWPDLLKRMVEALRPNGRLAGDHFGEKHAWAGEPSIHTVAEAELREQLKHLVVEAFDIEDGFRPSAGGLTRWHAFGVAARKP